MCLVCLVCLMIVLDVLDVIGDIVLAVADMTVFVYDDIVFAVFD